ncbi:Glycosyltransferase involved in cell wall bisynthesis [Geosporobacter subterraneus DSM 17957]|uniref:Glycosyltransferase involved in cell wall bisynthesis n=1 Tax=Geosporobacter subterraneus DSM 17957 TaxID=1121919 RepID=A0A1M6D8P2_9FIRM|nr:glycosyltransferase [Geosporobacter subterraneus]SHI69520.1 Glycosyltransferase involved in cell wall bisynthesis [Geosporobacter subterraneus DSM 17957]
MEYRNIPRKVICISSIDWFPIPTRKQQVMSRLPKDYDVLYIEPPITLISPLKDRGMTFKLTEFLKGTKKVKENITVYCPPPILPFGNMYPWINRLNQWWQSLFIKRVMKENNMNNPLIWTYMPNSLELVKRLEYQALIYDCVDEHSEYKGFIRKEALLEMEKALAESCDLVFVTAEGLYESKRGYNPHTYCIPNGVNFELFNAVDQEHTAIAEEIEHLQKPIIGFVGVIQEWIDLKLIHRIAKENPDGTVLMVGPVGAGIDVEPLKSLPNVCFVGGKKPEELPHYIKAFDVCINPFRKSNLTKNVSPLKFYEYLATGKPIVTVDMPAVQSFGDCVMISKDEDEFLENIGQALRQDNDGLKQKRIEKGRESSWDKKVVEILQIIDERLGGKKHGK